MPRTYSPNPKHKWPKGFGSLCPPHLCDDEACALLRRAIPSKYEANALYVIDGDWCFEARPTRIEIDEWHGYPVPGFEVPADIFTSLRAAGELTEGDVKRLRKQRALPDRVS